MATTGEEKVVGVWFDETPEPEYRAWVVADEILLPSGETDWTQTVKVCGSKAEAIEIGRARAEQRGVRLAIQD